MEKTIQPAKAEGTVRIPGSKSHTVRALVIATLANGESTILNPLDSSDTRACLQACRALGADIIEKDDRWIVQGTAGRPVTPENIIDVGNSGASLRLLTGMAALQDNWVAFTGDAQIRSRPAEPLLNSLADLGAGVISFRNNGMAPYAIGGRLSGGKTTIACPTSQFLSGLLVSAPLATGDSEINISLLNERPYAEITLSWLDSQNIEYTNDDFKRIKVTGNQSYTGFALDIPGDFSSATFFFCAAAVCSTSVTVEGIDFNDPQGDKAVVDMLEKLGCTIEKTANSATIHGAELTGCDLDLNATPDALPALAVTACFAKGTTRLVNVPQARLKETDRIAVMCKELTKMGAKVEEMDDGLIIHGGALKGARVKGWDDHRIVMALSIAALGAEGETVIEGPEAVDITFPEFFTLLESITRN